MPSYFFEASHTGFPLSAHAGIRKGLLRPRFSLIAHLIVVGIFSILSMNAALHGFTSQFSEPTAPVARKIHASFLPCVWLHSCDRGQLSLLESFMLSLASAPITWFGSHRSPSWIFCWVQKPCCTTRLSLI